MSVAPSTHEHPNAVDHTRAAAHGAAMSDASRRRWLIVLLLALLVGAGLRVGQYLAQRSYWHDEASLVLNVFDKPARELLGPLDSADRKSTRLNSSHGYISYAVFCLKKKKKK